MRDPDGTSISDSSTRLRHLNSPADSEHFLQGALARELVADGTLVPFVWCDPSNILSPRWPFVSQPSEWCDSQLFDAAELTLDLEQRVVAAGFDLKDGSAWNVMYDGTRPIFCDLLSFERLQERQWWAAGQFARQFITPLLLAKRRGMHGHDSFRCWRDGVAAETARRLLGPSRFLTRYWPLLARAPAGTAKAQPPRTAPTQPADLRRHRERLMASLGWMLSGVRPRVQRVGSDWSTYTEEREHYPAASLDEKRRLIRVWLGDLSPQWVIDLGCNTGEFSRIALELGHEVIAIDSDHDCIERLYSAHARERRLHPLVAVLDDLVGGRGWAGSEHPGLPQRMSRAADVLMMLALIHHLAVGASVPLAAIADFARACTRRWLIVEWLEAHDPQLLQLCAQRRRNPADFVLSRQRQAFVDAGFVVKMELSLAPAARTLALLWAES
jgi:SAM-dependent methyltransferase